MNELPTDLRNLEGIHEAIDSFNEQSKLGSIEIRALHPPTGWRLFALTIPFTGVIQLVFYRLDTPVQLRRGLVPLYAYLADEKMGQDSTTS